ncbi:MAG: hypothetical protein WBM12_11345, partial [Pseudolabrys sp.]
MRFQPFFMLQLARLLFAVRVANPKAGLAVGTTSPRGITAPMPKYGMSALGQKQTCAPQKAMSALPPKADMCGATTHVCFVPIADMAQECCSRKYQLVALAVLVLHRLLFCGAHLHWFQLDGELV